MALDRFGAEVFLLLKKHGISTESVLTLGRQHFAIHPREFEEIPGLSAIAGDAPELASVGEKFSEPFFHQIGARTTDSLDASDYESCSRIHDLNEPIPESWHSGYDVVFDGGTLEHVFHFPNAVANAMNLVKDGGLYVCCSPSNNYSGHGFYQFSPELFFRIFDENNGFQILLAAFAEFDWPHRKYQIEDPKTIGSRVTFGGRGPLQLIIIARKEKNKVPLASPPYQSDYTSSWSKSARDETKTQDNSNRSAIKPLKRLLRRTLPAGWVRRYDCAQFEKRRKTLSMAGIRAVNSLDECWRQGDQSGSNRA